MIVDIEAYNNLGRGSTKRVLCRCDDCGCERLVVRYKLTQRGGEYRACQRCAVRRSGRARLGKTVDAAGRANMVAGWVGRRASSPHGAASAKALVMTACAVCGQEKERRVDAVRRWNGSCRTCANREVAERPEVKAARRRSGLAFMERFGPKALRQRVKSENLRRGPDNNLWRGGVTPEHAKQRSSHAMQKWRLAVFQRDNYTCQMCSQRGGDLHADHIEPFALHPALRFEPANGRALCVPCHRKYGAKVFAGKLVSPAVLALPEQEITP